MCSVSLSQIKYYPSFGFGSSQSKFNSADKFIEEMKKQDESFSEGNWYTKNFGTTTGAIPLLMVCAYELYALLKIKKLKKEILPEKFDKIKTKYLRNIMIGFVGAIPASIGINKYLHSKTDENYIKISQKFEKYNENTNAKLADKFIYSSFIGAMYNPISGIVQINKNIVNDPITGRKIDKLIKHELVHAKQYETVARSKNGIKKINYAVVNNIKQNAQSNPIIREAFEEIYRDYKKSPSKYKDTVITINGGGSKVKFKDYIEAIHIMLHNPKAGLDDIPMIVDKKHYQNIIDKQGPLSEKEEEKAEKKLIKKTHHF